MLRPKPRNHNPDANAGGLKPIVTVDSGSCFCATVYRSDNILIVSRLDFENPTLAFGDLEAGYTIVAQPQNCGAIIAHRATSANLGTGLGADPDGFPAVCDRNGSGVGKIFPAAPVIDLQKAVRRRLGGPQAKHHGGQSPRRLDAQPGCVIGPTPPKNVPPLHLQPDT